MEPAPFYTSLPGGTGEPIEEDEMTERDWVRIAADVPRWVRDEIDKACESDEAVHVPRANVIRRILWAWATLRRDGVPDDEAEPCAST